MFTCIESAEMISALKRRASSIDNFVLPVPVEPRITISGTFLNILQLWKFFDTRIFSLQLFFWL